MARDDDRRQHAEEVLGVDADRGEQGVSDDGAARVHQPASTKRTFTMSHSPTVLAAEATHHLNQSDCTRNVVRPAQRSWAPAYQPVTRPSMMSCRIAELGLRRHRYSTGDSRAVKEGVGTG